MVEVHFHLDDRLTNVRVNLARVERPEECVACGLCAEVCPVGAIEVEDRVRLDEGRCVGCSLCVQACPRRVLGYYELTFEDSEPRTRSVQVPRAEPEVRSIRVDLDVCEECEGKPCLEACPEDVMRRVIEEHVIDLDACRGCLECVKVCPHGAVSVELDVPELETRDPPTLNRELCVECDRCHEVCPTGAAENVPSGSPDPDACIGCYVCVAHCPTEALKRPDHRPRPRRTERAYFIDPELCIGCRICYEACPVGAVEIEEETRMPVITPSECVRCGLCAEACPTSAIDTVPTDRAEREVRRALVGNAFLRTLQELLRSRAEREFGSLEERERRLRRRLERKLRRRLRHEELRREVRKEVEEALCELVLRVGLEHGADLDRG